MDDAGEAEDVPPVIVGRLAFWNAVRRSDVNDSRLVNSGVEHTGKIIGERVGAFVGWSVGAFVGCSVGFFVGCAVGTSEGWSVGVPVGELEGLSVGCFVGDEVVGLAVG